MGRRHWFRRRPELGKAAGTYQRDRLPGGGL